MRKLVCPQCRIGLFFVMNDAGERLPVYVTDKGEVVPKHEGASLDGYDLSVVHCLGCSWKGSPKKLLKY